MDDAADAGQVVERSCHGISGFTLSQWPSEAKFVTIRVGQVEEPLAPFAIARCCVWTIPGRDHARMERVNVGMVEDNTSPPRPIPLGRLGDEIEIVDSSPKARKPCIVTTMNDHKSHHALEADGARHVVGGQRDGTDALDHRGNAPSKVRSRWHIPDTRQSSCVGAVLRPRLRTCRAHGLRSKNRQQSVPRPTISQPWRQSTRVDDADRRPCCVGA
jgi:hypothetical protein